jgi:hypothetical protein
MAAKQMVPATSIKAEALPRRASSCSSTSWNDTAAAKTPALPAARKSDWPTMRLALDSCAIGSAGTTTDKLMIEIAA